MSKIITVVMIGIIGGSGFYDFLENNEKIDVTTPFGEVTLEKGNIEGIKCFFIPRHGKSHSILPSNINYRANIYAAHKLNLEYVVATNAVGSLRDNIPIGTFAVPNQILDLTSGRHSTFFDGSDFKVTTRNNHHLSGVVHKDMSEPYANTVRNRLISACQKLSENVFDGGTMVVLNGPRFETPAEINAYRILGADFAGMTSAPEAFLARELEVPYATLAVVTNMAAGMQKEVTHEEVSELFAKRIDSLKLVLQSAIIQT